MNIDTLIRGRIRIPVPEVAEAFAFTRRFITLEASRGRLTRLGRGAQTGIEADSLRAWASQLLKDGSPGRAPNRNRGVITHATVAATSAGARGRVASPASPNEQRRS